MPRKAEKNFARARTFLLARTLFAQWRAPQSRICKTAQILDGSNDVRGVEATKPREAKAQLSQSASAVSIKKRNAD